MRPSEKVWIFIATVMTASVGWTAPDMCSDLAGASCGNAEVNLPDGTGLQFLAKPSDDRLKREIAGDLSQAIQRNRATLWPKLETALTPYLAACRPNAKTPTCADMIEKTGVELMWRWLRGSSPSSTSVSARALFSLRVDPTMDRLMTSEGQRISREYGAEQSMVRMRVILSRLQELYVRAIERNVSDPAARARMITMINSVRMSSEDCFQRYGNAFYENASYTTGSNQIIYCAAFSRNYRSEYNYMLTLAHELGHAIDPCNWSTQPPRKSMSLAQAESIYPLRDVVQCLRSQESIGARRMPEPNRTMPAADFYQACTRQDQIAEVTADWLASQVGPEYFARFSTGATSRERRNGILNSVRDFCDGGADSHHPPGASRIDRIYYATPEARRLMGCAGPAPGIRVCRPRDAVLGSRAPRAATRRSGARN